MISIDIVVPSYRLQSQYLLSILGVDKPAETKVRFLIIADNPKVEIPAEIEPFIDNDKVIFIRNAENLGVCTTRNIGIDNAIADWILFLDDDIKPSKNLLITYIQQIKENPDEVGFFGDVVFPPPINSFTGGIKSSGILSLFSVNKHNYRKWTPTANVIVKRSAIGDTRFDEVFAKAGAGEEIDFFLNIHKKTHRELKGIKNANVYHNWWYDGKRKYTRFMRWPSGVVILMKKFPEYTYYTFPNAIESMAFGIPLVLIISLYFHNFLPLFCVFIGIIAGECLLEFMRLLRTQGFSQSKFFIEVVLIKAVGDISRLANQFKMLKIFSGTCQRFNSSFSATTQVSQRFWAGLKFISYIAITWCIYYAIKVLGKA